MKYLELFLRNLLLGEDNILSNREMHIAYKEEISTEEKASREEVVLNILKESPNITLEEVAVKMGKSVRTVKVVVKALQELGRLERIGGKKSGYWKVN